MQIKMVDLSLLSAAEVDWLNSYHLQVWEKVFYLALSVHIWHASQSVSMVFAWKWETSNLHAVILFYNLFEFWSNCNLAIYDDKQKWHGPCLCLSNNPLHGTLIEPTPSLLPESPSYPSPFASSSFSCFCFVILL